MKNESAQCLSLCVLAISLFFVGQSAAADLTTAQQAYRQKDYAVALREATPLAEQGNPDAQLLLARMFLMGQGVSRDPDQAIKWFRASADQGNADAEFFMSSYYLLPRRDIPEGMKWLRLSAEQGNQDAQLLLGRTYADGRPEVPHDPVQGEMWLRLAAKDNLPFYESQLAAAERGMSPGDIEKGKALAATWKPKLGPKPDDKPPSSSKSR